MVLSDIQKLSVFTASQLCLIAALAPWAVLKESIEINDDCTIDNRYQFRHWGGACGRAWYELKDLNTSSYFALIHSMLKIRILTMVCIVLLNLCLVFISRTQFVTVLNVIVFILSMMATTMYFTEQNTTMVIPIRILNIQGPGFWAQVITASLTLAVVITEFYTSYKSAD